MVNSPELLVLGINFLIACCAFLCIYPRFCGANFNKLAFNDIIATCVCVLIAGQIFWETGQVFNALFIDLNWFWFALLSYILVEIPFMIWYFKKYDLLRIERED